MTNGAAIEALMQGPKVRVVKTFQVTIPEGLSRREAAPVIHESGVEGSYLKAIGSREAIARARGSALPQGAGHARGLPVPGDLRAQGRRDRRRRWSTSSSTRSRDNFGKVDLKAGAAQEPDARTTSLIIASLIERETPSDKERPLIASVIYNRLRQGEPLGIDATIRYGENNWSRRCASPSSSATTPYNTRLNAGPAADADRQPRARLAEGGGAARRGPTTCSTSPSRARATRSPRRSTRARARRRRLRAAPRRNGGKAPKQKC